ncbi:MAG TPA: nuclear transport factor 2 family protein [Syntrophorhabdaceae bacterium]|nr:nuclear transport factor 2 family protein [Syntrophorhabdaceae bacterium]
MTTNYAQIIKELDKAWNARDIDRILEFYSDDFELSSLHVKDKLGVEDGTLNGKPKVREWWKRVLTNVPDLSSQLISVAEGVDSVAYIFRTSYSNSIVASIFFFDSEGKIRKELFHG